MKQEFTISIYSENHIGLLSQVSTVFTRRNVNIESITSSESAIPGIHKITIVAITEKELIDKVQTQLDKRIDVVKSFVFTEDEVIHQEIALYKVPTEAILESNEVERLIRKHNARILEISKEYTVIEKTGHKSETQELFEKLSQFGVTQFTRSGRVAVTKLKKELLSSYLDKLENEKIIKD
ncbi:MAG: acetolactate synthase small subunit [Chlorobi bacterium]|nr:acetolactate synthase small subunit [Chlorobiota bacterium]